MGYFGDSMLNDLPEFAGLNPSIEHFSRIVCEKMLSGIALRHRAIHHPNLENATCWAAYVKDY